MPTIVSSTVHRLFMLPAVLALGGCSAFVNNDYPGPVADHDAEPVAWVTGPAPSPTAFGVRVLSPGSDVADLTTANRHVLVPSDAWGTYAKRSVAFAQVPLVKAAPPTVSKDDGERDETYLAWAAYCNNGETSATQGMSDRQWALVRRTTIPHSLVLGCRPPK